MHANIVFIVKNANIRGTVIILTKPKIQSYQYTQKIIIIMESFQNKTPIRMEGLAEVNMRMSHSGGLNSKLKFLYFCGY